MARHFATIISNNNNNHSSPPTVRCPSSLDTMSPSPDLANTISATDTLDLCCNNDPQQPSASMSVSAAAAAADRLIPSQYDTMIPSFDDIAFDIAAASQQLDVETRIPDLSCLPDFDRMLDDIVSATASDSFPLPPPPPSFFRWSQFSSSASAAAAAVIPDDEWTRELSGRYDDEQLAAMAASCFDGDEDPSTAAPMSRDFSRNFDQCRLPTLLDLDFDDRCRTVGMRWELIGCASPAAGVPGPLTGGVAVGQSVSTKLESGSTSSSDDIVELMDETYSEWIDTSRDSISYGSISEYNGSFPAATTDSSWHYIHNCPDHHHRQQQQQQRLYDNGQLTTVANTAVYHGMTSSPVRNRPVSVSSVDSGCSNNSSSLADCLTLLTPDSCCSSGDSANYRWEELVETDVNSHPTTVTSPVTGGRLSMMSNASCTALSTTATAAAATAKPRRGRSGKPRRSVCLWQFLRELLHVPQLYESAIRWIDRNGGIFKIEDSVRVAKLWGECKNRPAMNYDKLSRSIRQYYKQGIIRKTNKSRRLVFQFCPQYLQ